MTDDEVEELMVHPLNEVTKEELQAVLHRVFHAGADIPCANADRALEIYLWMYEKNPESAERWAAAHRRFHGL